jgi:hypothetical protein
MGQIHVAPNGGCQIDRVYDRVYAVPALIPVNVPVFKILLLNGLYQAS